MMAMDSGMTRSSWISTGTRAVGRGERVAVKGRCVQHDTDDIEVDIEMLSQYPRAQ
jgi:hypothetical protein